MVDSPVMKKQANATQRSFSVVCFDWDGTAVADRHADAAPVRSRVERLAALGVDVAVVSGTDAANIDGQLRARPEVEGRVFLFLSRGSEVYVVGPRGRGCSSAARRPPTRRRSSRRRPRRCATSWLAAVSRCRSSTTG